MKSLIKKLNDASYAYYNTENPIMTDIEYDTLLKKLQEMERETGIILSNSPTQRVGAPVLNELTKVTIQGKPMLSLDKVHSAEEVYSFAKGRKILGLIKCDGLSTRLIYENGKLVSAHTRGNGYEGSDVTEHIKNFTNVPLTICASRRYVVDGESIIKDNDFATLEGFKNSRNTASGALSLLDVKEVKNRKLSFILWDVIEGEDDEDSLEERIFHAMKLGFEVVKGVEINSNDLSIEKIDEGNQIVLNKAKEHGIPCDGVVWKFDSVSYGDKMGSTSHHFNNGIAWKPEIETMESSLLAIEWTMGRTGQLTPVALIEPIEMDGATIERCSMHNISVMFSLLGDLPYVGQKVRVYRANMIIPQILDADQSEAGAPHNIFIPKHCPICGGETIIKQDNDSQFLYCSNPNCQGKLLNRLDHYCSKKGMDIKNLSKATLEKLIDKFNLQKFSDIYNLAQYKNEWALMPGFGQKSVERILNSIELSKETTLDKVLAAAGIPLVGASVSKELVKYFHTYTDFRKAVDDNYNFAGIDGFGEVICENILTYDYTELDEVIPYLSIDCKVAAIEDTGLQGLSFVITGKLGKVFKNRAELEENIKSRGGLVKSSVTKTTSYLIANEEEDTTKYRTAKSLGTPILTEEEFWKNF
jgi:DNA ligase (NAD+)